MHSRKCNEVLIDDIGDIAESSGEGSEEIGSSSLTNNLQADEAGGNILLSNTFLAETVSSQLSSDNQASAGTSILTPTTNASSHLSSDNQPSVGASNLTPTGFHSANASSQLSSDNQAADRGFGFGV